MISNNLEKKIESTTLRKGVSTLHLLHVVALGNEHFLGGNLHARQLILLYQTVTIVARLNCEICRQCGSKLLHLSHQLIIPFNY